MENALAAFSNCVAVLQIVGYGLQLIELVAKYAHDGGTLKVAAIEKYVNALTEAIFNVLEDRSYLNSVTDSSSARVLLIANKQSLFISQQLMELLQDLGLAKIDWWEDLLTNNDVAVYFMVYTIRQQLLRVNPQTHKDEPQSSSEDSNPTVYQDIRQIRGVWKSNSKFMPELAELIEESEMNAASGYANALRRKQFIDRHYTIVKWTGDKLSEVSESNYAGVEILGTKIRSLQRLFTRETDKIKSIIDNLAFPGMDDRMVGIRRAHTDTYQWIFRFDEDADYQWDNFMLWLASQDKNPVYWIRGKPGSGKSTLVREMLQHLKDSKSSNSWEPMKPMLLVTCFFWYAGTLKQRSSIGFLQCLLHQIFRHKRDSVHASVSPGTWQIASVDNENFRWSIAELREALHKSIQQCKNKNTILLLIDGLDEFDGDDEERLANVNFLKSLADNPWVKLCASSRPWNVYKDAFMDCPHLRLEDLTRGDIHKFIRDSLEENNLFMRKVARKPTLLQDLADNVTDSAEGVFLWVRLVMRDLLKAVRDGCQLEHLFRILDRIPRDLDDYFSRMMHQMDPAYQHDAAILLKSKLCDMSYKSAQDESEKDGPQLRLFDLLHLDDSPGVEYFVLDSSYETFDLVSCDFEMLSEQYDSLERRLASRSMGLLETVQQTSKREQLARSHITFLHRTVKDFLCTPRAQAKLDSFLNVPFNALAFRCTSLIDRIMLLNVKYDESAINSDEEYVLWLECFLHWAASLELDGEKMTELYHKASPSISLFAHLRTSVPKLRLGKPNIVQHGINIHLCFAQHFRWKLFLEAVPTNVSGEESATANTLLDLALRPCAISDDSPLPDMVEHALSLGADPNAEIATRYPSTLSHSPYDKNQPDNETMPKSSIWVQYLAELDQLPSIDERSVIASLKIMLNAGAAHHISIEEFNARHEEVIQWFGIPSYFNPPDIITEEPMTTHCGTNCPEYQRNKTMHVSAVLRNKHSASGSIVFDCSTFREINDLCDKIDLERSSRSQPTERSGYNEYF